MVRTLFLMPLFACQAQLDTESGPSFGGDLSFAAAARALDAGQLPDPGDLSEAGLLSGLPVAIGQSPCPARTCVSARSAWIDDGLLVGIGIDGTPVRPPVELAFALDASCSVAGSEDVRAATVEIALEAMGPQDRLALCGFTGPVAPLIPSGPVDAAHARRALAVLDELPAFEEVLRRWPADSLEELLATLLGGEADADTGLPGEPTDTGTPVPDSDDGELERAIDLVLELIELTEGDPVLEAALFTLARDPGSAVDQAAAVVLESLPDGTEDRASRLVFVSDFEGASATQAVEQAAERYVGTSVLGVTAFADTAEMNALATSPGAHTFDALEPAAALATWEQRFDALVAPNAWGVQIDLDPVSEHDWSLERRFGATAGTEGASAFFASTGHAVQAVVLKPRVDAPSQPRFVVELATAAGTETLGTWARVPNRLVQRPWGEGDDEVALELAWRVALYDAVAAQASEALELWDVRNAR